MKKFVNYILWYFGYVKNSKYQDAMRAIRIQLEREKQLERGIEELLSVNKYLKSKNVESDPWKDKYLWSEKEIEKINKANDIKIITLNEEIDKLKEENRQLSLVSTMKKASILKKK